ncbi:unnamed protein product [Prunus armeniaca]
MVLLLGSVLTVAVLTILWSSAFRRIDTPNGGIAIKSEGPVRVMTTSLTGREMPSFVLLNWHLLEPFHATAQPEARGKKKNGVPAEQPSPGGVWDPPPRVGPKASLTRGPKRGGLL